MSLRLSPPTARTVQRAWGLILGPMLALGLWGCYGDMPPLPPLAEDAVILAFGDSLTRGIGAARGRSYPDELARLSGRRVVNRGVPGEISADGARRLPDVLQRVVPDLLVLCHGGNDMLRKLDPSVTEANLRSMIETARARGVPVVLLGVPRPGVLLQSPAFYQELAEAYGLPYQGSVLGDVLGDRTLKADLIHPNATGYRRLAQAIHTLLVEAGAL